MTHSAQSWQPDPLDGSEPSFQPESEAELSALRVENAQLKQALANRSTIDQAKGVLMLRYGMDADTAFDVMRRWSQHSNVKLRTIAVTLVRAAGADDSLACSDGLLPSWLGEQIGRAAARRSVTQTAEDR